MMRLVRLLVPLSLSAVIGGAIATACSHRGDLPATPRPEPTSPSGTPQGTGPASESSGMIDAGMGGDGAMVTPHASNALSSAVGVPVQLASQPAAPAPAPSTGAPAAPAPSPGTPTAPRPGAPNPPGSPPAPGAPNQPAPPSPGTPSPGTPSQPAPSPGTQPGSGAPGAPTTVDAGVSVFDAGLPQLPSIRDAGLPGDGGPQPIVRPKH